MNGLWHDIRFDLRTHLRSPGRPYRILLWSASGVLAACVALVFAALMAIPRPTHEELARDSTVPTPSSGPEHGWRYASDGTRLYERVSRPAGPRRGVVLYVAGITGLGGDEQPELVAALVDRGFEVRFLHPRGTGYSDGAHGYATVLRAIPRIAAWVETRGR